MSSTVASVTIQTKAMQLVLEPIENQVEQLIVVNDAKYRENARLRSLVPAAQRVEAATDRLTQTAKKIAADSGDETFREKLVGANDRLTQASHSMMRAARSLTMNCMDRTARTALVESARGVMEGTLTILVEWDNSEIRKIVKIAQTTMDKLNLVEGIKSMQGLVVCFKAFSDQLLVLANAADRRQRELLNPGQRERIVVALTNLKKFVPMLSTSMQTYVKNSGNSQAKASRDYVIGQIMLAITEIIRAIEGKGVRDDLEQGYLASTLQKVRAYLAPGANKQTVSSDLDRHMEAIVRNSMAVAHVCAEPIRQEIFHSCHEVTRLRRQLSENLKSVQNAPGTQSVRDAFDATAELLCEEFRCLDRLVNSAVIQQVATVFVEPSTHIHRLVGAAVAPARTSLDPILELNEPIEAFKSHAAKLSQVATSAATSSQDARRVRAVQSTAAELDKLTPQIVSAAVATRRNPDDVVAKDHLELLRREWASKVQLLTGLIDEITDTGHFMAASEASIREEMGHCRDAIREIDTEKLANAAQTICGRARRIADVGRAEISNSDDPNFKARVQTATTHLESAIPGMSATSNQVISNIRDPRAQQNFADAMRELLEGVREVRCALEGDSAAAAPGSGDGDPVVVRKRVVAGKEIPSVRDAAVQITATQLLHGPKYMSTPSASESRVEPYNPYKQMFASSSVGRDDAAIQEKKSLLVGSAQSAAASVLEQLGKSPSRVTAATPAPPPADFGYLGNANTAVMADTTASRLIEAAQSGDRGRVEAQCSAATYLGGNLIGLAERAANSSTNREKIRLVHVTAAEIEKLVPQMTETAHVVCDNPGNEAAVKQLSVLSRSWAEKIQVLAGALDSMVTPWSGPVVRLARVVQAGGTKLDKEAESMRAFSRRMEKLAEAAIAAADAEDNAEVTGGMAPATAAAARDPAAAKRVALVEALSEDVKKLTPKVIAAAQQATANPENKPAIEKFEMLRREWASKVKTLAVAVDDITIGTSSPAEALTQAAERSERAAIRDQGEALQQYAAALKDVAEFASAGCGDPEKVHTVRVTSGQVEKLTVQLVDAANDVVEMAAHDDGSIERRGLRLDAAEKMELLKREWASKVHLLTAVVDDLTSEVSSPVDRLAGSALAVSRSTGVQKDRQVTSFRDQASSLRARVARVEERCQAAVKNSVERGKVHKVRNCTEFMAKLTPEVISAARELSENPDQVTVEHFQLLRRQWASRAQLLVTTLDEIADADMSAVSAAVQDLLSPSISGIAGTPASLASFASSYQPLAPSSSLLRAGRTRSEERLSSMSSSETQRKRASMGDDMTSLGSSLSSGGGGAVGPKRSFLTATATQPTPPSARSTGAQRRRPLSAVEPSATSWREMTQSEEELSADISYRSIQEAARLLQEEVNEFEMEGNELIKKANEMADQMIQMAAYTRGRGELQSKADMITTAKAIAANGSVMVSFAKQVAMRCVDKRMKKDLEYYAEVIPTISQQLRIISSVKAATPRDPSANVMLVKNAQNLMQAVTKTLLAAEAACMKGLQDLGADDAAMEVALQWKRKVYKQRTLEAFTAPMGSRGLRKLSRYVAPPLAQAPN